MSLVYAVLLFAAMTFFLAPFVFRRLEKMRRPRTLVEWMRPVSLSIIIAAMWPLGVLAILLIMLVLPFAWFDATFRKREQRGP